MKTIFELLNLPEDSDFETLKARYEELKSSYSEQRFLPGEEGTEGAKKLGELEDCWRVFSEDRLAKDKAKKEAENYANWYSYVEQMVKEKRYDDAQSMLDSINEHDGAWHYYQALVFYKREWMNEALSHLKDAVRLSPDNVTYKESLAKMTQVMANANTPPTQLGGNSAGAQQNGSNVDNCLSNCCSLLCCMECMTLPLRCCGG